MLWYDCHITKYLLVFVFIGNMPTSQNISFQGTSIPILRLQSMIHTVYVTFYFNLMTIVVLYRASTSVIGMLNTPTPTTDKGMFILSLRYVGF